MDGKKTLKFILEGRLDWIHPAHDRSVAGSFNSVIKLEVHKTLDIADYLLASVQDSA